MRAFNSSNREVCAIDVGLHGFASARRQTFLHATVLIFSEHAHLYFCLVIRLRAYVSVRRALIYALTGVLRRPQVRPHGEIHEAVHASINRVNYEWDKEQADRCRDPSPESCRHSGIHPGRLSGHNSGKPLLLCMEHGKFHGAKMNLLPRTAF
jgi:hypothetical protein